MLISSEDIIEGKLRGYFLFEDIEYDTDDWIEIMSVLYENGIVEYEYTMTLGRNPIADFEGDIRSYCYVLSEDIYFKDSEHVKKMTITEDQLFRIRLHVMDRYGELDELRRIMKEKPLK